MDHTPPLFSSLPPIPPPTRPPPVGDEEQPASKAGIWTLNPLGFKGKRNAANARPPQLEDAESRRKAMEKLRLVVLELKPDWGGGDDLTFILAGSRTATLEKRMGSLRLVCTLCTEKLEIQSGSWLCEKIIFEYVVHLIEKRGLRRGRRVSCRRSTS